jgi:hypothetical protein
MPRLKHALYCSISERIPFRSCCVALVVGTILNLINQGDVIFTAKPVDWIKIVLTLSGALCGQHLRGGFLPHVEVNLVSAGCPTPEEANSDRVVLDSVITCPHS